MKDFTLFAITLAGSFPFAILIMRLIFKKSIMFTVSVWAVVLLYVVSVTQYTAGMNGMVKTFWATPVNFAVGTAVFIYINSRSLRT